MADNITVSFTETPIVVQTGEDTGAAAASAAKAQAWAEGTLPGGAGTFSAKEYSQQAAASATISSDPVARVQAELGDDGHLITSVTVGSVVPDTTTVSAGNIILNIPATPRQGYLKSVSLRLSAAGTGKVVVVNYLTNKIVRTIATVTAASATSVFLSGGDLGNSHFCDYYETIGYQTLTGGNVRQAAGTDGRAIANASWDGTDGDAVTLGAFGSTYAIAYELLEVARGATVEERLANRRLRGGDGMSALFDVLECYLDGSGDIQSNLATPGINDINLAAATNPNARRTGFGVRLKAGLLQTNSITCRTVVTVCRVYPDSPLAFIISGSPAASSGITTTTMPAAETVHIGAGGGVHPLWHKASDGSRAHELLAGGWMIVFRDLGSSQTSIFGFGGRHSSGTLDRVSQMDIAFIGASTLAFTDAQRATIGDALARRLLDQGIVIFNRDATEKVYGALLTGDSAIEGRDKLYSGNATFTATTTVGSRSVTLSAVTGTVMPQMRVSLSTLPYDAIIESQTSGTVGGAGVYVLTVAAKVTDAVGTAGTATHYGVSFDDTLVMAGTGETSFRDLSPLVLGENQQNDVPSALASPSNAGVSVGIARWRRATRLTRNRRLVVVSLTRGASHICPFGAITAGVNPSPALTYHPSAAADAAGTGSAGILSLFELTLRQWYRASAQARNQGVALEMNVLVVPGGLEATVAAAATGGSAAAFQGYIQAFFDAVKLYTNETPVAGVYQSQTGAGGDPTLIGYIRDGQLAFKNANTGAVLVDTDIAVPSSVNYAGVPHGLIPPPQQPP